MRPNQKKNMVHGTLCRVDYNITLCPLQSRLQHIYHGQGQPYAKVDLNPMPESTLSPFGSGLSIQDSIRYHVAKGFRKTTWPRHQVYPYQGSMWRALQIR